MPAFDRDPLVARVISLLAGEAGEQNAEDELDMLVYAISVIAAEQKWFYIMQLCLPYLDHAPEVLQGSVGDLDDDALLNLLLFGHRLNDAFHLKLRGRKATSGSLGFKPIKLPARRWNLPRTDRWVTTTDLREMLDGIRQEGRRLPKGLRRAWISRNLRKRCSAMNARLRDGALFKLTRHAMATGRQWYRGSGYSMNDAVHVRLHYNAALLTVAVQVKGQKRHKTKSLISIVMRAVSVEERPNIDSNYALRRLSIVVFDLLWKLRTQVDEEEVKLRLSGLYDLLLTDLLDDPIIREKIGELGEFPTLVITTHGELAQIPFAALHDGTHYLAERYNVVQAGPQFQNADFAEGEIDWETLTGGEPIRVEELRVLSDTVGLAHTSYELDELREVAKESNLRLVEGVSTGWTNDTLRWLLATDGAALLSTHIDASPTDPRDATVIGPAGARLTMAAALETPMNVKLLMLSGCLSTNQTDWFAQGENSLPSLFRRAGAEAVISTLWPISDYVARIYNVTFVRALSQGVPRGVAHGSAQRAIMRATASLGQMQFGERTIYQSEGAEEADSFELSLSHPGYWSAFILTGAWR